MPGGPTLLPMSSSTRWRAFQKTNAPRRAARVAWSAAAAMSLVAATASLIAQSIATGARERSAVLARRLEMVSLAVNDLSTQRDRLRGQLADTTDELSKVQGELTIDRNVEDTLFKAIQTAQAHKPVDSKSPQFADVGR